MASAVGGSVLMLGGLISSVLLAQRKIGPTVVLGQHSVDSIVGKSLMLSLVSIVHVWSCLQCWILSRQEEMWKSMEVRVGVCCTLLVSILSLAVWAALVKDQYEDFLVVCIS